MEYYTSDCNSDECSLVCPKCNEKVEYKQTIKLGETFHCCSKEKFCLRIIGETDE